MDFALTEEQGAFSESVRTFARRELQKGALDRAHSSEYPWDVATRLGELDLLGITVDESDGGAGGTLMDAVIAIQEVAAACPRSADVIQAGNFGALRMLAEFGNPEQKERYLKPLLRGEGVICVAMTEPDAGSAVTDLATTATADGKGFRINGNKIFTTHSLHASLFLVYVRFGPGVGGIGSVLIKREAEGLSFGAAAHFMGGEDWNPLYFEDVYVPPEDVLLGPGGFKSQISGFNVNANRANTNTRNVNRNTNTNTNTNANASLPALSTNKSLRRSCPLEWAIRGAVGFNHGFTCGAKWGALMPCFGRAFSSTLRPKPGAEHDPAN